MKFRDGKIQAIFLALPMLIAVIFALLLPYGAAFIKAFGSGEKITVFQNAALINVTLFTIKQAFFSVLISLAIGLPGAWIIGTLNEGSGNKGRFNIASLLRVITAIPFAMPSILVVLGFVLFFGNSGWINRFLAILPGHSLGHNPLRILYRWEAIVLAHGFFNFPLVIRLAGDGLARARGAYGRAASSLGASPVTAIFTVILPLSIPAVLSAALLVFLYSFTSFAIVLVLGGGPASTTLAVEIYRHARIFLNYRNAGALAIVETLIALTVFLTYVLLGRKAREIKTGVDEKAQEEKVSSAPIIFFTAIYGFFALTFILGPLLSVVLESFLARPSRSAPQVFSLVWWKSLELSRTNTLVPALFRSLFLSILSATLSCILAISASLSVKLFENQGKSKLPVNVIRFFASAPLVSSGIVLALGCLILYGSRFSRSPLTLVVLHAVSALPFAFNSISEAFRSMPANTVNAALISGASPVTALLTTALPVSMSRLRSAWGLAAALSMGELNAVMMLGMENWETLPLYIFRATGSYRYGTACAAGNLLILCCAAGLFLSEARRKKSAA